jgi:hypothetical protein
MSLRRGFSLKLNEFGDQNLKSFAEQAFVGLFLLTIAGIFLALSLIHTLFFDFLQKTKATFVL